MSNILLCCLAFERSDIVTKILVCCDGIVSVDRTVRYNIVVQVCDDVL
jgi:hypothetical protein